MQTRIPTAPPYRGLGLGLGIALLLLPACGGGGGDAPSLRGDGSLTGQLLTEQSPGQGPSAMFMSSAKGGTGEEAWQDRLDRAPRHPIEALLSGPPLEGQVGGAKDRRDLVRIVSAKQSKTVRIRVDSSLGLRSDFLQSGPTDPARELRTVVGRGELILRLEKGEDLIVLMRPGSEGLVTDWRLQFEELGESSLQASSLGGNLQAAEARRALLRDLLLPGKDHSALGEVLVTRRPGVDATKIDQGLRSRGMLPLGGSGMIQRWILPASSFATLSDALDRELAMSRLLTSLREEMGTLAEFDPNLISPPTSTASFQSSRTPNDPFYATWQWNMRLAKMDKAWQKSTGSASATIAIMDTGLLTNHPDLQARVSPWSYDFITDPISAGDGDGPDADPQEPPSFDIITLFHGTYVAGVLGARTDNKIGIAGGTWKGKILGIRVIGQRGMTSWDRIQAWRYMTGLSNVSNKILPKSERPRVLNMSWAMDSITKAESDALDALHEAGTILVAAMGNDGQKNSILRYPAAHDKVIAVGAVGQDGKVAPYSNGGSYIDVVGPGGIGSGSKAGVLSTWARKPSVGAGYEYGYFSFEGTSLATPLVCAAIALMDTQQPGIELPTIRRIIREGSVDIGLKGWDQESGHGLLDAAEYLRLAKFYDIPPVLFATPTSRVIMDGEGEAIIEIANAGGRVLRNFQVQPQGEVSGALAFSFDVTHAPTRLHVRVDRSQVKVATYRERFLLVSNGGSTVLDLSFRKPIPMQQSPILVRIQDGNTVIKSLLADARGNFRFEALPVGDFVFVAGIDLDQNGLLGDSQEWYLAIPVRIAPGQPLNLGSTQLPWKN